MASEPPPWRPKEPSTSLHKAVLHCCTGLAVVVSWDWTGGASQPIGASLRLVTSTNHWNKPCFWLLWLVRRVSRSGLKNAICHHIMMVNSRRGHNKMYVCILPRLGGRQLCLGGGSIRVGVCWLCSEKLRAPAVSQQQHPIRRSC